MLSVRSQLMNVLIKRNLSALYLSGEKAKENYAVLTPYIDFHERFKDLTLLENNLKSRQSKIELNELLKQYELYNSIQLIKQKLEKRKLEIVDELRKRQSTDPKRELAATEMDPLKIEGKTVREDLKSLKEESYRLDDIFINNFLALPNEIHTNTPIDNNQEIFVHLARPQATSSQHQHHLSYDHLIEYHDPICYYLKNEAAAFDLFAPMKIVNYFKNSLQYTQFSNPDFIKTILMDAATLDHASLYQIRDEHASNESKINQLHLAGGSSLTSFLGYITKLSLFEKAFPLKFVTMGKQYAASSEECSRDLYGSSQATAVQFFLATTNEHDATDEIDMLVEHYIRIYKEYDQHFRICYVTARDLLPSESMRISMQMFSPVRDSYVEVGNISFYRDFISKRLLFNWRDGKQYKFPHIVSGTVVNMPILLGVLLENGSDISDCLNKLSNINKVEEIK